jgi:hypothetical protein
MSRWMIALTIATAMLVPAPAHGAGGAQQLTAIPASVEKSVAVLLMNFAHQPSEPWTKEFVRDLYFGPSDSVSSYYAELSEGQMSVTGSVFGYLKVRADTSRCRIGDWAEAARKAARRSGIALGGFTNIVYVFPYQRSCWWNGFAGEAQGRPEGRDSWINGLLSLYVAVHELGHNFGVGHASSLTCTSGDDRIAFSTDCSSYEYGDPYDVMGYGGSRLMHAWHRWELDLLAESEVRTVTTSGNYRLSPVQFSGDGPRMLRIPRPNGGYYFLEIRQSFGTFDDFGAEAPPVNGVSIRTASTLVEAKTKLIDTAPETCTFNDAPLIEGQTFGDVINRISITTIGVDSTGADVEIRFGNATLAGTSSGSPTVSPAADTSPPTIVPRVSVTQVTGRQVAVNWPAADDDVGVDHYVVSVDGEVVGKTCDLMLRSLRLTDGRTYQVGVKAVDAAGNVGPLQTTSYAVPDFTSPTLPSQVSATVEQESVTLRWSAGADNVAVAKYRIQRSGQVIAELGASARSYVDTGVVADGSVYSIVAFDAAGNASRPAKKTLGR